MSRSGYTEDIDDWEAQLQANCYRGAVESAIRGRRGQAFLREMREALDAMPVKRLISHELEQGGEVCAIGSVGARRGINMSNLDPDAIESVAGKFGIAEALAREIVYENDEGKWGAETPEERWQRMRAWVDRQIPKD